jgi:predicted HAD superfamily Cof-like phosphohydrolase
MVSKKNHFVEAVKDFHAGCGYQVSFTPSLDDEAKRILWMRLVNEEVSELSDALKGEDLVAAADAIADIIYVIIGAGLAFGLPISDLFDEVHKSNMTKIKGNMSTRKDGKILKGSEYKKPDIVKVLKLATDRAVRRRRQNKF